MIPENLLLSRDDFRNEVFKRDKHQCANCGAAAQDAHHIVERRLFPDGGYYLGNGASVCGACHLKAESTELPCDTLREKCGIKLVILPPHIYEDTPIDKWGNYILPNGQRLRGELFNDESVQKVIKPVLHLFTNRVKHPRTHHVPWSPGVNDDDRVLPDLSGLEGEDVVVTVKMDGEQTTMYRDGFHARSIDTPSHPSRDWLWSVFRRIGHDIPENWRLCMENLYAKHSIHYHNLPDHLLVHSMWNERNECLSWDDTVAYALILDLQVVPELYRGPWDEEKVKSLYTPTYNGDPCEGYVVRVTRSFPYREFMRRVGKYVRPSHVQTHGHWMREAVVPNELRKEP